MLILSAILVLIIIGLSVLLFRASRLLLRFDSLLQNIVESLDAYSVDLKKLSSANIGSVLEDHPEVAVFHKRNLLAQSEIQSLVDEASKVTPKKKKVVLPRPDLE